jgi:glycosyltransferase involved in cell wall biosynthesis
MREGLPVISTDAAGGGARFVLDDGQAGLLVPRGDRAALAQAMSALAEPATRRRYAELARARAASFAPGPVGAALLRLIAPDGH